MSDELRGEQWQKHLATKQNHRQARRSSFDAGWDAREAEIVGRVSDVERGLANASARVLELSQQVAGAKAEALNEVADFLDVRGILWHGDSGVTVMEQPYSGQLGVRLTDWLRAQAVASESNVSRFPTRSEQETL